MIKREHLVKLISDTHQFFRVTFKTRGTQKIRTMVCRNGVKQHLKGGTLKFNPKEKNLLVVFSVEDKGYRSIPIENILSVKFDGVEYVVNA